MALALTKKQIEKLIAGRHPAYHRACKGWAMVADVMTASTPEFAAKHLFKHRTEYPDSFKQRQERAAWVPITRSIRESFINHLFKVLPTFGSKDEAGRKPPPAVQAFFDKATRDGRPFLDLLEEVAEDVLGDGVLWLGIDRPAVDPGPTKATEIAAGVETYAYPVLAANMLDGRIDGGSVVWCVVRECFTDNADPLASTGLELERFRLWTATESIAIVPDTRSAGKPGGLKYIAEPAIPHSFGRPPFAFFSLKKQAPAFVAPGLLQAIAYLDREVFNLLSQYIKILTSQTFSQLAVPSADPLTDDMAGMVSIQGSADPDDDGPYTAGPGITAEGTRVLAVGEEEVFTFDPKTSAPPTYVAPPPEPAETLLKGIGYTLNLCYMLACLDAEHNAGADHQKGGATQGAATPGITMAYVYDKLNARLLAFVGALQAGAIDTFKLVQMAAGADPEAVEDNLLDMPDSFDIKTLSQDLMEDAALKSFGIPSATFEGLVMRELVRKRFPKLDKLTLDKIDSEIEEGDPYSTIAGGKAADMLAAGGGGAPASQKGQQGTQPGKGGQPDPKSKQQGKDGKQGGKDGQPGFKGA